ncbi:MAG: hypothetical protein JSW34_02710 [Candidatus Zixiibacteriota bacterium]|nr:MAG: hypothetical protein JSW34_02710 [candidate division Zixibacteria bacterium]
MRTRVFVPLGLVVAFLVGFGVAVVDEPVAIPVCDIWEVHYFYSDVACTTAAGQPGSVVYYCEGYYDPPIGPGLTHCMCQFAFCDPDDPTPEPRPKKYPFVVP